MPLTVLLALALAPVVSAATFNGRIALEDRRSTVLTMNQNGTDVRSLGDGVDPSWSPDGSKLIFSSGSTMWVVNPDGTGRVSLSTFGSSPTWSPDGTRIAYISNTGDLSVMNADGTGNAVLTDHTGLRWSHADWSPDGSKILLGTSSNSPYPIQVVNADGTGLKTIEHGQFPRWSPDGSTIAFHREADDVSMVWTTDSSGAGFSSLIGEGMYPDWSPDGAWIAMSRERDGMWAMHPDGSSPHKLNDFDGQFAWQPTPVDLRISRREVSYGKTAVLTARLDPETTNRTLKLFALAKGGKRRQIASGDVNADGILRFKVRPAKHTLYSVSWAGDSAWSGVRSATAAISVRADVQTRLFGHYRKAGGYQFFHRGDPIIQIGAVFPNHRGVTVRFKVQRQLRSGYWGNVASGDFKLRANSAVIVGIALRTRGAYRFSVTFFGDRDHLGATSKWRLVKVTS